MKKPKLTLIPSAAIAGMLFLTGCGQQEPAATPHRAPEGVPRSSILLAEAPDAAIPVGEARATAQPGDRIALIGQIGGTVKPIAESYASFVIADEKVMFCDEMEDDHCATPWDACCEDPEMLAAHRASVTFLDADGQPMPVPLKQEAGLSELDTVTVEGTVAPQSTPGNLIIHADGVYPGKPE